MNPRDIETDWLCTVEFLSTSDAETRAWDAEDLGYLLGYAELTDTRVLALVGHRRNEAYEIFFGFSSPEGKERFLNLVRSNEDMGYSYVRDEFLVPTPVEIQNARPLATVVPRDVIVHATLIASMLVASVKHDHTAS